MRPCIEQPNDLAPLSPFRSWLDCTTNTFGYDFRKGQVASSPFFIGRVPFVASVRALWQICLPFCDLRAPRAKAPSDESAGRFDLDSFAQRRRQANPGASTLLGSGAGEPR
jgi:hypothetical protein